MHFGQIKAGQKLWTISARLTILYLIIFGSTLIIFSSVLFRSFTNNQQNEFDIALYNHAVDIAQGISVGPRGNLVVNPDVLSTGGRIFPFQAGTVYIQILTLKGVEIGRSRNLGKSHLPVSPQDLELLPQTRAIFQTVDLKDLKVSKKSKSEVFRLLTALSPGQTDQDFILQVAVPEEFITQTTRDLKKFLGFGIPLTLAMAALAGLYLSRKALKPVRNMINQANRLNPENLSERIPVPQANDEIKSLALTLNDLLNRLQKTFESQERFIADASHELKTPLAILRGELDVFRGRPRSSDEVSAFVSNSLQELTYLSRIVEDLLILARVDTGSATVLKDEIRLDEVVLDVISKLEVLGRKKGVKIRLTLQEQSELSDPFTVRADSDLMRIFIKNLIENAIKYSPENQVVEVQLQTTEAESKSGSRLESDKIERFVTVEVTDHGPGIPEDILPKIFDRFYRGPHSGQSKPQGAGLGLAIVQKIIEVHGGKVLVKSTLGKGTVFTAQIKNF